MMRSSQRKRVDLGYGEGSKETRGVMRGSTEVRTQQELGGSRDQSRITRAAPSRRLNAGSSASTRTSVRSTPHGRSSAAIACGGRGAGGLNGASVAQSLRAGQHGGGAGGGR